VKWPWPAPQKGEICAIILVAAIASVLMFTLIKPLRFDPTLNNGFGPGWECSNPGWGEPVCIKKLPPASERPSRAAE
jgi:hypothetical protein